MGTLRVVRAGAGSGKTWELCRVVADAVAAGVDPARVVATTFTRKAAAELKGRIQARLLADERLAPRDRLERAERLELAAIGTVHSVGRLLLTRYSLRLGLSPRLAVLEDEGSSRALRDLLGRMDPSPWAALGEIARRFALGSPQELVLDLLDAKRGNRIDDEAFCQQLRESAERLCHLMASDGRVRDLEFDELYSLVAQTLDALNGLADSTVKTETAKRRLRQLRSARSRTWADFAVAARLQAGKKSGADDALAPLRQAGARLLTLRGLHADVRALADSLVDRVLALGRAYADYKRERGLADFMDLEVQMLSLLETPDLAESLRADYALVVVDEFHDTNPLQLAIFQRLRSLADASCWVGDAKQSIYGFRGTDPELIRVLWESVPKGARDTLPENHRSQAGLVQLVGKLFTPLFGLEATLTPVKPPVPRGIERWVLDAKNNDDEYGSLAAGIAQLATEGIPLRDIAVLTRTNPGATGIGRACRDLGLPAVLKLPGLLSTREGALALAGLRLVADRRDSLAAVTILHILGDPQEATPAWLPERLRAVEDVSKARKAGTAGPSSLPWDGDPRLAGLGWIEARNVSPAVAVQQVIQALEIGCHLSAWGDAAQRAANLDALVGLAQGYEQAAEQSGAAATLSGLIVELEGPLTEGGRDAIGMPFGIDAVTIVTYHASKGLEWPVVILTGLDFDRAPDLWKVAVSGGDATTDDPLAGRTIRYWPWPFGRTDYGISNDPGLNGVALASPEGVEAARRAGAEGKRLLYVGFTRAKNKLVLAHRRGAYSWLQVLPGIDTILPPDATPGEHRLRGIKTTYVVRPLHPGLAEGLARPPATEERWLAPLRSPEPTPEHGRRYHSPSMASADGGSVDPAVELLPGEPVFPPKNDKMSEAALGNAVHAYLTALPSLAGLNSEGRMRVAERCLNGFGMEAALSADQLVSMGERLRVWVGERYPGAAWHTEVPVTAPREGGGQWNGSVDLLLHLPDGSVVVVDHKSSPIRRDHLAAKAASYAGQLVAYREAVSAQGLAVTAAWIHLPLAAAVVNLGIGG